MPPGMENASGKREGELPDVVQLLDKIVCELEVRTESLCCRLTSVMVTSPPAVAEPTPSTRERATQLGNALHIICMRIDKVNAWLGDANQRLEL